MAWAVGTLLKTPELFFRNKIILICSLLSYNPNCMNQVHSGLKSNVAVVLKLNYAMLIL